MESDSSGTLEKALGIDMNNLDNLGNINVRRVALLAREDKKRSERDPSYKIHGTYSEAYQGEQA